MSQVTENKVISAPVPMTPLQEFWHYFKRNKGAVVGLVYVVIVLFIAIFANWIAPYNPAEQFRDALLAPPAWQEGGSMAHLLGTDDVGRDVLSRLMYGDTATLLDKKLPKSNWLAMWIFLGAIAVVALLGADSDLRPSFGGKPLSMVLVIQMFMLLTGALIIILTKTNPASISKNEVFRSGMIAIVAVYGIAWMAETMFGAHMSEIQGVLGEMVKEYPWAYAIVLLLVSKFVNSQAAALAAIVPVALAIGVDPAYIVASAPACYGYYILPTYPSDLAAIQFDRSGTTHIGRFVINHSFILPGLIGVSVSCVFGWIFAAMYGFL